MNDTELEQNLKKHYQELYGTPPAAEKTWEYVAPHLLMQGRKVSWWRRVVMLKHANGQGIVAQRGQLTHRPIQRIGIALAVLVVGLMVVAATGYAAIGSGPLSGLFSSLGVKPIVRQFSDYHQSKSIDGYTLTIQKAYADANRVLIGFTGEIPADGFLYGKFSFTQSKLTTEQGIELRLMQGGSTAGAISGNLYGFDASSIQGTPKELHLHLVIPYGSQLPSAGFQIAGHLTFNFAVPFHPGNVVSINHSVTASGTPVTLKQVVISPSETRAYIEGFKRFYPSTSIASILLYKMTIDGRTYNAGMVYEGSDVWQVNFDDPSLASKKGRWTLTIQQMITQGNPKTGKYELEPVSGATWAFQFTVK